MTDASSSPDPRAGGPGLFNYLVPSVRHSLHRNGEVLTRRDANGNDAGSEGVRLEEREVLVHNGRLLEGAGRRTVEVNGFELLHRQLEVDDLDFFLHQPIVEHYYRQCAQIVQETTGATEVHAFDHNVRSAVGKQSKQRISGGQQVQGPGHLVHGDYTLTSGPQRLRDLAKPPGQNDTLRATLDEGQSLLEPQRIDQLLNDHGRFAIINVWRNIANEPVATHPLALCDAQSVQPADLVVFEIHYQDRVGENYFAKHSPGHRWYYYPEMTRNEVLLIKQWDSAGSFARSQGCKADSSLGEDPCTFSFHSAFNERCTPPNAPQRWSIEVRCVALYG